MPTALPVTVTVARALQIGQQAGLPRLDVQLLLLHSIGRPLDQRAWLISHDDALLTQQQLKQFEALLAQRQDGVPIAYLTGQKEFFGLTLQITPATLDPRPDTETLVEWALDVLQSAQQPRVLDLGTGSGAIALAIQSQRPDAQVWAVDQSQDALQVAKANGAQLALPVQWLHGSWFEPVVAAQLAPFDLIVSNPPYIRPDDHHLPQLRHEPLQALVSSQQGLHDIGVIAQAAPAHLKPGGMLLLEHGWDQAQDVATILQRAGFKHIAHRHDLAGHIRCSGGRVS
ncbi:peptide chain release factor N(5)-glutamine methyltransferase [Lampropedia aestuarii]|uniref:Release factor glutamine methyltransferase n=1 Tax=Lampropedia aestuarii TaxID=2562762 RepID=A0A4V3YXT3_9BURK|nr:peptide chain release factor N(5)-glutamine methyltransferase [Lampropedia aestuarii]THJ36452.1 peptide chain release factor N(5)-glutamine methyltransferase [Lampropedia aestuarii]